MTKQFHTDIEVRNGLRLSDAGVLQAYAPGASGSLFLARNARWDGTNYIRTVADNDASILFFENSGAVAFFTNSDAGNTVGSVITWAEKFRITKAGVLSATTMPTKTIRLPHTWAVKGSVSTGELPGFFVSLPTGQTAVIANARYASESGTSTFSVRKNGTDLTDLAALSMTSTAATTDENPDVTLADGDYIDINITAASSLVDPRISVFVEYTV